MNAIRRPGLSGALAIAAVAFATLGHAQAPAPKATPAPLPFTWGNDVPAYVERGIGAYDGGDYEAAEREFLNARLLESNRPEPLLNLGLTAARQNRLDDAVANFSRALDAAGNSPALRGNALYNRGVAKFQQAMATLEGEKPNQDAALEKAIEALDDFDAAQRIDSEAADRARANAQAIRRFLETQQPPPQQQQQQQSQDGDEGEDEQQQQQQQQQQGEQNGEGPQDREKQRDPQSGDEQQQQPQDQQQPQQQPQDDPSQGEQQQQQQEPQSDQGQQGDNEQPPQGEEQQQPSPAQEPREMTPEEAKRLLNMLGDAPRINLRKGKPAGAPVPKKPW